MLKRSKNKGFSCFDCRHANCYGGSHGGRLDPPEPPSAECSITQQLPQEVQDWEPKVGEEYETIADMCPRYEPLPTGTCIECKKSITSPRSLWHLWVQGPYVELPVCSVACQTIGQVKADKEVEELANYNYE